MTRPRALTSTFRSVIALLTALLVAVIGATALPAVALAGNGNGNGQAKGQQADRTDKPGKAHEQQQSNTHQQSNAPTASNGQSAGKTQQGGSSDKAEHAPKAQETQPTHGNSAQAHESKTSPGASASKPAGNSSEKGDPKGNNGTVKLAGFSDGNGPGHSSGDGSTPMHPSNDPHLPCTFSVEGYGFDAVASQSELTFEQHAPTRGGSPQSGSVPLDGDSHSGGGSTAGYDGVQDFNLAFEGDPHPKHGYHVKLTAVTSYSQGSNVKHKVFWVEPCEAETPGEETPDEETPDEETPDEETPDEETPDEETPDEETPDEETPDEETPDEETPDEETPGDNGVQDTVDENGGNTSTVVLGAQASVQESAQAATQSAAGSAQVPTAVEAGLAGEEWSRSVLPLLAILFGFGTTFVALVRRRTRVQTVKHD